MRSAQKNIVGFMKNVAVSAAFLAFATTANSAVIYSHTAGPYIGVVPSSISNTWVTSPLTVSFTTASALAPNLALADVSSSVLSWTGGTSAPQLTISSTQPGSSISYLNVSTDALGAITAWQLQFVGTVLSVTNDPLNAYLQSQYVPGTGTLDQMQFRRQANGFNTGSLVTGAGSTPVFGATVIGGSTGGSGGPGGSGSTGGASTSVPVPASAALLCVGLFALARLRKNSSA